MRRRCVQHGVVLLALAVGLPLRTNAQTARATAATIARLGDAVVTIVAYRDAGKTNIVSGTGFRIADGRVVTALRHFRGAVRAEVFNTAGALLATVTTIEQGETKLDLAVLGRIDRPGPRLVPARRSATLTQRVLLLGPSRGDARSTTDLTVTAVEPDDNGRPLLRLGAPIGLTSVGAPVINVRGEFVGMALGSIPGRDDGDIAIDVSAIREVLARPASPLRFPARDGTMAAAPVTDAPTTPSNGGARATDSLASARRPVSASVFPERYGARIGADTARNWSVELYGCARLESRSRIFCYLRVTSLGAGGTFGVKGADLADSTRRKVRSAETLHLGETTQRLSGWRSKAEIPLRELESARVALEFAPPAREGDAVRLMVDVAGERVLWFGPFVLQRAP